MLKITPSIVPAIPLALITANTHRTLFFGVKTISSLKVFADFHH